MAERLVSVMKWLCCVFVVYSLSGWRSVSGVTVRPEAAPSVIEAQAKFFQDFFSVQLSPYKIEFGHVCEDPHSWEQRYRHLPTSEDFDQGHRLGSERHFIERHERSRPAKGLYSAKVRWGDKNGGYGEHYWDLNHAGSTGSHGGDDYSEDDGSYREDPSDGYNDHSEESHRDYEPESYPSDEVPQYEESGRAKRAHSRSKLITEKDENYNNDYEEPQRQKQKKDRKNKYHRERYEEIHEDEDNEKEEPTTKSPKIKNSRDEKEEVTPRPIKNKDKNKTRQSFDRHLEGIKNIKSPEANSETKGQDEERPQGRDKNHFVLVVNQNERQEDTPKQERTEPNRFVNYEDGSGVRQHYSSDAVPSASTPRLFIEAQTGHIVDRMTGQAYVLQPLVHSNKYN